MELNKELVDPKEIGKIKLEYVLHGGIFISPKTYSLWTKDNNFVCKAKGFNSDYFNYVDYLDLLYGKDVKTARTQSVKDWTKGQVTIEDIHLTM